MEQEYFFTGYCRCLDSSRTVEVIRENGHVTEVDCAYPDCIHKTVCLIAQEIHKLSE